MTYKNNKEKSQSNSVQKFKVTSINSSNLFSISAYSNTTSTQKYKYVLVIPQNENIKLLENDSLESTQREVIYSTFKNIYSKDSKDNKVKSSIINI